MGDAQEVVSKVIEWARAVLPEVQSAYDYDTGSKPGALPDVVVECTAEARDRGELFPQFTRLQQAKPWAYVLEASFMVGWASLDDPAAQQAAAHQLRDFATRLKASIRQDGTLGGRVQMVSEFHTIRYRPGHVEFEDGTRGREMRLELAVVELQGS